LADVPVSERGDPVFDIVITNGRIVDGTGNPWYGGDVGILDGAIAAIGNLEGLRADRKIDAKELVVAPGFIDIHSHSDTTLIANGNAESKIRQGITTEVNGNCGNSAAPWGELAADTARRQISSFGHELNYTTFGGYFDLLEEQGISVNAASFVGHSNVRQIVIGNEERAPTGEELERMKALVDQGMKDGAIGLSTGLEFVPSGYADTDELIELCKIIAPYNGIYATHQRNRDTHYEQAATEAIEIGRKAGVRVQQSHFVPRYPGHDKMPALLWLVDQARREGLDVTLDVITPNDAPRELRLKLRGGYHWAGQGLGPQLVAPWGFQGSVQEVAARLRDPEARQRFRSEHIPQWKLFGCPAGKFRILGTDYDFPDGVQPKWDGVLLNNCQASPELIGKTLAEIAGIKGMEDPWDAAMDVLIAEVEKTGNPMPRINILGASTAERDSITAMKHPGASIVTDRAAMAPYGALAGERSPNSYGAFARVFRKYVRDTGTFTEEEAVQKMTSVPANSMRLLDRGVLRPGARADIAIFDPDVIADNATIEEPSQYADGVEYVLINGQVTIENGDHNGTRAGMVLRGAGA